MNRKGVVPRRPPVPKPATIAKRAAEIRRKWTDDTEERRRVEKVEPLIFETIAPETIGLSMEPIESPI